MHRSSQGKTYKSLFVFLPNMISMLRLPIAAAFLVVDGQVWRGVLLSAGAMTDALDGWVARRFGLGTKSGAVIDPLFDKLFILVVMASFIPGPYLGWTQFAILMARDVYVGAAFIFAKIVNVTMPDRARLGGKVVTFLQMVTLFVLLFAPDLIDYCVVAVGVSGGIAIVDYTVAASMASRRPSSAL